MKYSPSSLIGNLYICSWRRAGEAADGLVCCFVNSSFHYRPYFVRSLIRLLIPSSPVPSLYIPSLFVVLPVGAHVYTAFRLCCVKASLCRLELDLCTCTPCVLMLHLSAFLCYFIFFRIGRLMRTLLSLLAVTACFVGQVALSRRLPPAPAPLPHPLPLLLPPLPPPFSFPPSPSPPPLPIASSTLLSSPLPSPLPVLLYPSSALPYACFAYPALPYPTPPHPCFVYASLLYPTHI